MKEKLDKIITETEDFHNYLLEECVMMAPAGLKLEFGVAFGGTINRIASVTDDVIYGFDTFTGLPEAWNSMGVGAFSSAGILPSVRNNVKLIKGLFQDTLDDFLKEHTEPVGFCHVDSDLYSSCDFILNKLKDRFFDGTIIIFDELANYPGYEEHEYKSFLEFLEHTDYDFEFIGKRTLNSYAFRLKRP